ncbi:MULTISPECIES: (2E,6E)-farnesyl diphosphate synthase [Oleiagrimonas]|uniref:(2E,6E)-farnesyl diphosphate synthase n=1 Tax=Oleiagrimonas citrea TaxID=1665687 RepID=A0A846ZK72_9GAMM|nr:MULTISPECIES: farnesyl diphosphate synthase [Oleiagrimonas]NKZ37948.1 (2E,6E)-farnesyl diphosphate synthase [Oleiagrimonas citrea]RAP57441.1 (2E,6E)-farnesyl diphosphate synthase [Oleiagrimonas sp. MCCC 1A03011]
MNPNPPEHAVELQTLTARANRALERLFPAPETDDVLQDAMRYAVLGGGKRLRPLLTYAAGQAVGDDGPALDAPACAVELIHAYSLVHDDLPAMDDDDLRRGQPTCHIAYGEAMAILAGDALQALAFELLARDTREIVSDAKRVEMLRVLGSACGAQGMAGGQAVDLTATGKRLDLAALERMHALKTGALIRASVRLGALAGGCDDAETLQALDRYAHAVGLAFQVRDDLLDVEADTEALGKTAGKDAAQEKSTFPALLGMQASRERLRELTAQAEEAIAFLGEPAALLATLARYAAERGN